MCRQCSLSLLVWLKPMLWTQLSRSLFLNGNVIEVVLSLPIDCGCGYAGGGMGNIIGESTNEEPHL